MASFADIYGGRGLRAVQKAETSGMSISDIIRAGYDQRFFFGHRAQDYLQQRQKEEQTARFQNQIRDLQSSFDQELKQQGANFAEAQRRQQEKMQQMQQQALEAQTRQAAPQKEAQVLGVGKSLVIRPGASTRFSRPELQIKSMNI
tara:strand:+ start:50 stop:487 length:438 start_codon:yes stop_codon:yes gene_type:complete